MPANIQPRVTQYIAQLIVLWVLGQALTSWLCHKKWNFIFCEVSARPALDFGMTVETLCAAFRVYFAFASQNITILYIFSQLFFHLSFGSLKQKVTLGVNICIIPSIKYSPRVVSVQLWLGFGPNRSQKKNWSFFSVQFECRTQEGFNGEEEGGEELDLGLLLLPGLDGVEEPHGVEQPHRHVAPFLLLPVHLQQKCCSETERN